MTPFVFTKPWLKAIAKTGVISVAETKLLANEVLTLRELREEEHKDYKKAAEEIERLDKLINTPELHDFAKGVVLEAVHQREKWGTEHDAGKTAADWFWLIGYLAQKAMYFQLADDTEKALHHCITTAAAMANWHAAITGERRG